MDARSRVQSTAVGQKRSVESVLPAARLPKVQRNQHLRRKRFKRECGQVLKRIKQPPARPRTVGVSAEAQRDP